MKIQESINSLCNLLAGACGKYDGQYSSNIGNIPISDQIGDPANLIIKLKEKET
jgi:hypothetical protein